MKFLQSYFKIISLNFDTDGKSLALENHCRYLLDTLSSIKDSLAIDHKLTEIRALTMEKLLIVAACDDTDITTTERKDWAEYILKCDATRRSGVALIEKGIGLVSTMGVEGSSSGKNRSEEGVNLILQGIKNVSMSHESAVGWATLTSLYLDSPSTYSSTEQSALKVSNSQDCINPLSLSHTHRRKTLCCSASKLN